MSTTDDEEDEEPKKGKINEKEEIFLSAKKQKKI